MRTLGFWKELGNTSFLAQNYHFSKIERLKNLGEYISNKGLLIHKDF
jgi:hypothetical protein